MAEKIIGYEFSDRFKKEYEAPPKEMKENFEKKLHLFLDNPSHPSLRIKKIVGTVDRWEGSLTMSYRFTFQFLAEGKIFFRRIGRHDILRTEG